MYCYLSTSCFGNTYVSEAILKCKDISEKYVEISAPHFFQPLDKLKDTLKNFRDLDYQFTLHNYFPPPKNSFVLNMASKDNLIKELSKKLVEDALNLSIIAESKIYGIHAGYLGKPFEKQGGIFEFEDNYCSYSKALDLSVKFVNEVAPKFEKNGVNFLIENLFPSQDINHSLFCSLEQIKEFISQVPKTVGFLLDLGHLNISSNLMNFDRAKFLDLYLNDFSERLLEIHISENKGINDDHLAIKKNSWQLNAIKLIQQNKLKSDFERVYCLEARNSSINELKESISLINECIA